MILYTACVHQVGDDLTADPQYCSDRSNGYRGEQCLKHVDDVGGVVPSV